MRRSKTRSNRFINGINHQVITVVLVTHEPDIAEQVKRTIRIQDGLVVLESGLIPKITRVWTQQAV